MRAQIGDEMIYYNEEYDIFFLRNEDGEIEMLDKKYCMSCRKICGIYPKRIYQNGGCALICHNCLRKGEIKIKEVKL